MEKKYFRILLTGILLLSFFGASAQDYAESALLFSRNRPAGSARIQGIGGSQIALGGDYSSSASNPAGLGMFNRSEVTFSLGLSSHNTAANYLGRPSEDNRTVFNVPGFSLVWHMPKENGAFLGGSLGISFTRNNDFNRSTLYAAPNQNNSIVDYFIDQAFGATTAQFDEGATHYNTPTGLAYNNYLIGPKSILNPPGPDDEYFTDASYPDLQQEEILVKGATNQWNFSYGANLQDRIFLGGGLGISSLKYESQKIFSESFNSDTLEYLQLNENLEIRGSGVNATLGAIARPLDFLQIGFSYTTPTFYNMTEVYDATMFTIWDNFDYYGDGSEILGDNSNDPIGTDIITSDYNLTVPSKLSTGFALLSKFGFIAGDVEFTNPSRAKYTADTPGLSYNSDNENIRETYRSVINYRVGAEFRYDMYRIRAGYGVQSNAYNGSIDADNTITSISGGAGIRSRNFYIDLAIVHSAGTREYYQPYVFFDGSGPVVDLERKSTTGMLTVGFTF